MTPPKALEGWLSRHRHPTNFWLHMLGIPAAFVGAPVMLALQYWALAGALFVGGYALQFIGHVIEGNRSGEEMLVRKLIERRRRKPPTAEDGEPTPLGPSATGEAGAHRRT